MKKLSNKRFIQNDSGFLIADFLFAFTMVIGIGIFMFALTFSLATIEVGQYIVWSTARNYSAAQFNEPNAHENAMKKFAALISQFPLLTNSEGNSAWFELSTDDFIAGELDEKDPTFNISSEDKKNGFRQPWTGVSTSIYLKLFSNINVPFLGKVATDKTAFRFPIRAFLIRNVSTVECKEFFYLSTHRYDEGIKKLEDSKLAPAAFGPDPQYVGPNSTGAGGFGEDNGC